jgi:galactose mutarotase-like enzyme
VLFPIVGSLKDNAFIFNNKTYHLPRHGFARDMEFELINKTSVALTFSLKTSAETLKMFPFDFELQIEYILKENFLSINYKVFNNNSLPLPFSIGAHPAFALDNDIENYSLEFQSDSETYNLLADGLLTNQTKTIQFENKKLPLTYSLFESDALVFKHFVSKSLTILENRSPLVKLHFSDFPSLGIWTKSNAGFICIEPWQGYSDTIECTGDLFKKEGILVLNSDEEYSAGFDIEVC